MNMNSPISNREHSERRRDQVTMTVSMMGGRVDRACWPVQWLGWGGRGCMVTGRLNWCWPSLTLGSGNLGWAERAVLGRAGVALCCSAQRRCGPHAQRRGHGSTKHVGLNGMHQHQRQQREVKRGAGKRRLSKTVNSYSSPPAPAQADASPRTQVYGSNNYCQASPTLCPSFGVFSSTHGRGSSRMSLTQVKPFYS